MQVPVPAEPPAAGQPLEHRPGLIPRQTTHSAQPSLQREHWPAQALRSMALTTRECPWCPLEAAVDGSWKRCRPAPQLAGQFVRLTLLDTPRAHLRLLGATAQ